MGAFSGCSSLTQIDIPSGVTYIGDEAFEGCSSPTKISIPSGVTEIEMETFKDCSKLASVTIPEGVEHIRDGAFQYCYALKEIYYGGSPSEWKSISISDDNEMLDTATIHFAKADE